MEPFYVHQVIELPEIQLDITHYVLHKGKCPKCGKPAKALLPETYCSGYGPRLCALIAEMSGVQGASRESVQEFLKSVFEHFHFHRSDSKGGGSDLQGPQTHV